jgi:uncharacterized protein (DUF4415 family)
MPALKPGTILPTDDEDAAIVAAVQSDPDAAPILTQEMFAAMRRRPGRPVAATRKVSTTIRFDADVLEAIKATGPGWQTRINDLVRDYVRAHS